MYYQLTYIIPSDAADTKGLGETIAEINKKITDAGATIKPPLAGLEDQAILERSTEEIEKIKKEQNVRLFKHRLGYPIKHVSYGFYVSVIYEIADKNQISIARKIDAEIKLASKILRFAIIKYNYEVFTAQSLQKEKSKVLKTEEKPHIAEQKEAEPLQKIVDETVKTKKESQGAITEEKPKKIPKTEIEELDKKLEEILNA